MPLSFTGKNFNDLRHLCLGMTENGYLFLCFLKENSVCKGLTLADNEIWRRSFMKPICCWNQNLWSFGSGSHNTRNSSSTSLHIEAETKWSPFCRQHFQMHFLKWKYMNSDQDFTEICSNIPAWVQIMAWHQPGNKPLSEPMMARLLMHKYVSLNLNELRIKFSWTCSWI